MKNQSKRTKIILAIISVLVIVVVAIAVFAQVGGGALLGTAAFTLQPQNPTLNVGEQINMEVNGWIECDWSQSTNILQIRPLGYLGTSRFNPAVVVAEQAGATTVTATCGLFNIRHSTTVTVRTPPVITPANPTIAVGQQVTLTTNSGSPCNWINPGAQARTVDDDIRLVNNQVGVATVSIVVEGRQLGGSKVNAGCPNGYAETYVTVK